MAWFLKGLPFKTIRYRPNYESLAFLIADFQLDSNNTRPVVFESQANFKPNAL